MYFDKAGKENTGQCLQIAIEEGKKRGITHLVVASTSGETGLQAAKAVDGTGLKLTVVTHATGFKEPGKQLFSEEARKEIESSGHIVVTGTDALTGYQIAFGRKEWMSHQQLIASSLWMFGQGTKVCVEIVAMASDAGAIAVEDVIAVAGTGRGADTVLVIGANSTSHLFDIKVREILAKPRHF